MITDDFKPPFHTDPYGMYVVDSNEEMMLEIRGFVYLSSKYGYDVVDEKQEQIAHEIVELLNEKYK